MHCSLDYRRDCQQHCYRSIVVSYISFITLYTGETLDFFQSSGNKPVSKLWLINNYSTSAHRICRVCTLFWTENSRTFQGLSRTPFSAKKSLKSVFFSSSTTWAISSWRSFCVCPFYAIENLGLIKLAPKFKDFPALTAITFQGLEFLFWNQRTSRTFKVRANPGYEMVDSQWGA